ncbi:Hypothetical protein PBC10988_24730 [Planctomycetales bacterium 10988]|nr:Hypothetical protein PBC10988_24730 [Planctomycetales bacterium 10988]
MNLNTTFAIFKRNFTSYFSNPTGYVFICLFVLLAGFAAFWPNEFFNANLANFDQLNQVLPMLMLIFIPAISMGIWSEERRQGTDELILTLPAADVDVVLGKYLASVAIFTVALLFSTPLVYTLSELGTPDPYLLLGNFIGYWIVGLAMLAVGMVASFLTANLTVAFILGVVFNAPLVFLAYSDVIFQDPLFARQIQEFSIAQQFEPFGRGVLTFSSFVYFISIILVSLYLCMVMIGRRHWSGRNKTSGGLITNWLISTVLIIGLIALIVWQAKVVLDAVWAGQANQIFWLQHAGIFLAWLMLTLIVSWFIQQKGEHFFVRTVALIVIAVNVMVLSNQLTWRWDISQEQLSSLSPQSLQLIDTLKPHPSLVGPGDRSEESFSGDKTLSDDNGAYVGARLRFTSGGLKDKSRRITSYDGKEQRFAFDNAFDAVPKRGDRFVIERPPVRVEAFISPEVPEQYVQTRLNLITTLQELKARAGNQLILNIHPTLPLSEEAAQAEDQYGIAPRNVQSSNRGTVTVEEMFLGVAIHSGTERVEIPFFDRGIPVEYELARSIATVSQQTRRKIGVVDTDVSMYGQFSMQGATPDQAIIEELEKQYEVEQVSPTEPISSEYDALLVVQPSSLGPDEMNNLINAIERGIPTALFEDPFPFIDTSVPASSQPRRAPNAGGMMGMMNQGGPPPEKGDITKLWDLLGIYYDPQDIVYEKYNPFPMFAQLPDEFVFVTNSGEERKDSFNADSKITKGLQNVLFVFPGYLNQRNDSKMEFSPLVRTGDRSGYVMYDDVVVQTQFGGQSINPRRIEEYNPVGQEYILATKITGKVDEITPPTSTENEEGSEEGEETEEKKDLEKKSDEINVVLVSDIDLLYREFFDMRARGQDPNAPIAMDFDNVPFVLNVLDSLAGDERFFEIRSRRRAHRTLEAFEKRTEQARLEAESQILDYNQEFQVKQQELQSNFNEQLEDIRKRTDLSDLEKMQRINLMQQTGQNQLEEEKERLERELQREVEKIERDLALQTRKLQSQFKLRALSILPIFPLALGLLVFLIRRIRETQGVSSSRLR